MVSESPTTSSACLFIPVYDKLLFLYLQNWETGLVYWKKQTIRERINRNVTAELAAPTSFIFANDDGSVRSKKEKKT